jgi:hypothetical protein
LYRSVRQSGIGEQSDGRRAWCQLDQDFHLFASKRPGIECCAGDVSGLLRLLTRPVATGSNPVVNTIGIVRVAAIAGRDVPPATITAT